MNQVRVARGSGWTPPAETEACDDFSDNDIAAILQLLSPRQQQVFGGLRRWTTSSTRRRCRPATSSG
jgi:hypothetical protein